MKPTPEQMRIACAEVCGWKNVDAGAGRVWGFTTRHKGTPSESDVCVDVPDYPNDLNAMHEAEKVLIRGKGYHQLGGFGLYKTALAEVCAEQHPIDATAAQRLEAFLRVKRPEMFE